MSARRIAVNCLTLIFSFDMHALCTTSVGGRSAISKLTSVESTNCFNNLKAGHSSLGGMKLPSRAGPSAYLTVGTVAAVAAAGTAAAMFKKVMKPRVVAQPNKWNDALLALCPYFTKPYELPAILNNGHVETIFAALFRRRPHILYDRELVHMPDGGVVALDSEDLPASDQLPADAPVLILLPGLTGGSEDSYVQHAVVHARQAGIRAVVFNSRGTSASPVTTAQFYSASYTGDLRCVISHVASQLPPGVPVFAAGWSLGANILTKYLGEEGADTPIKAAVTMCNPFNLVSRDFFACTSIK
jgi:hypothetical protein